MVKLKDWFNSLTNTTIDTWYKQVCSKSIEDVIGIGGTDMVKNRIYQVCTRLMNCAIVDEDGDYFNALTDLDEETTDDLNHCIQHNLPALVNAIQTIIVANDYVNGVSHNQESANPNRNSSTMVKEHTNYNRMQIQQQEEALFQQAIQPFLDLRDEFLQFVDYQVWK